MGAVGWGGAAGCAARPRCGAGRARRSDPLQTPTLNLGVRKAERMCGRVEKEQTKGLVLCLLISGNKAGDMWVRALLLSEKEQQTKGFDLWHPFLGAGVLSQEHGHLRRGHA